jgi:hypothetical protein
MSLFPYKFFSLLMQLIAIIKAITFAGKRKMDSGKGKAMEKGLP